MANVKEAKEEIKKGIRAYLRKDENGNYVEERFYRLPFYLFGRPGVGKTQIVRQIAEELGIGFESYTLTHHTRNTLLGLPVIRELKNGQYTEFTMSEIIAGVIRKVEQGKSEGILLLDEFNCASETVMPAMLSFLQTGTIGTYTLPDGWTIVLCGNPKEFNKSARDFGAAIMDRVRLLLVETDTSEYLDYAKQQNYHPAIQKFLSMNPDYIYCTGTDDKEKVVTCRSWENLSRAIKGYEAIGESVTIRTVDQFIKNPAVAASFFKMYWVLSRRLSESDLQQILGGKVSDKLKAGIEKHGYEFSWRLAQILAQDIAAKCKAGATAPHVSKMISNVFGFLGRMPRGDELKEHFYQSVNASEELLQVLARNRNPEYNAMVTGIAAAS